MIVVRKTPIFEPWLLVGPFSTPLSLVGIGVLRNRNFHAGAIQEKKARRNFNNCALTLFLIFSTAIVRGRFDRYCFILDIRLMFSRLTKKVSDTRKKATESRRQGKLLRKLTFLY